MLVHILWICDKTNTVGDVFITFHIAYNNGSLYMQNISIEPNSNEQNTINLSSRMIMHDLSVYIDMKKIDIIWHMKKISAFEP